MANRVLHSPADFRQMMDYDPDTGLLRWKERGPASFAGLTPARAIAASKQFNRTYAGNVTGVPMGNGYLRFYSQGQSYSCQRVAWAIFHGEWPDGEIDHINGNKTDNRICNLRAVPRSANVLNKSRYSSNRSGYTGVFWSKQFGKWVAQLKVGGKVTHLGVYSDVHEAGAARKAAEKAHGFHDNHGRG